MQLALYRAERPETFEEIIGQKHIVRILQNQLKQGTVSQAYLFTGTHGTGKTSTARILAKALNCVNAGAVCDTVDNCGSERANKAESAEDNKLPCGKCDNCEAIREGIYPDVIELDAASNNGVDDLRAIIDLVKYPPAIGKYKVYIIDEVHMLTTQAENAFLKTLEEPPEYAIFILATTDPQKVRATIKSRCMQLNFKRVTEDELVEGMQRICDKKSVVASKEALGIIAAKADGSVRDALSILEQCMAASRDCSELNAEDVLDAVGSAGLSFNIELTQAVNTGDIGRALELINDVCREGKDSKQLMKDWLEHYRNLMILRYVSKPERVINAGIENIERIKEQAQHVSMSKIERAIKLLSEYINLGRYSDRPRILLETAAVRLSGDDVGKAENKAVHPAGDSAARTGKPAKIEKPAGIDKSTETAKSAEAEKPAEVAKPTEIEKPAEITKSAEIDKSTENEKPSEAEKSTEIEKPNRFESRQDDAATMWQRVVDEISKNEVSFGRIVGKNSYGKSYEGDELTVIVKTNKMVIAQDSADEIQRAVKNLYGGRAFVTMRPGTVEKTEISVEEPEPTDVVIEQDVEWGELASDIGEILGVEVDVVDK